MTAIHETAYPRLKPNLTGKELEQNFAPNLRELFLMENYTRKKSSVTKLGFILTLKCYQCLGRPIATNKVPAPIKKYVAKAIEVDTTTSLDEYDQSSVRKQHIKAIRDYLQIIDDKRARKQCIKKVALNAAATKEDLADIINDVIEELVKSRFELPGFHILQRLARAARKIVNDYYYKKIAESLSEENSKSLDSLFDTEQLLMEGITSQWAALKHEPKSPTAKHIKIFIEHLMELKRIREHVVNIDIGFIPANRMEQFINEALSIDAADMRKLKPQRRYCLAIILIYYKTASAIDDIVTILIRWVRKLHANGQQALDDYRLSHTSETDDLINLLHNMLVALKTDRTNNERLTAIENCVSQDTDMVIERCQKHMSYANDNYYSFMLRPYNNKRHLFFQLLDQLEVRSSSNDTAIEEALYFIKINRSSHKEWLPIEYTNSQGRSAVLDFSWLPEKWFKTVTGKTKGSHITQINRKYYELAVITILVDDLNCNDAYVEGAHIYDDPNKQFITWDQFYDELENYCSLVKLQSRPEDFVAHLHEKLRSTACNVDNSYTDNEYLRIEKGEPILKKAPTRNKPENLDKVSNLIADKMPLTNIVDIIVDTEKWLSLSMRFKPLSGYETKIQDYKLRFVSTSFSYGCNVGPTQTERSLQRFTRKQIAWLFNHHVTEAKLDKVTTKVINRYNKFDLPKNWGTGDSVSVDGTYWDMYQQNLLAEHHIRYGEYGGLGYYHVSDEYIALFSNFIPCGVHEAVYIFDGINENDSEIQPNKIHGDTGAQSEVVFGFGLLLAVQIMPRIRNFKHLRYYRPSKHCTFLHIDNLFTEQAIDWDLIKTHYYDMLRVVMSIKAGKIKASTILRKLCSKSRKNKIYFAFRELGRVVRTIFLLNYINDPELRKTIQAATCKSEEFNNFIAWVMFGGGGTIADNMRHNQRKIIKYGHLIANIVILHVVANMTKVINDLRNEGTEINEYILRELSPYRTDHINRFGIFPLNMNKETIDLEYKLVKN